jgi:hypothetical protein
MNATADHLTAARAAALFVSDVSVTDQPTAAEVAAAVRHALRTHGGSRGCSADVAAAYGDHPELAAPRMRWARSVVESCYGRRSAPTSPPRDAAAHLARRRVPAHECPAVAA